MMDNVYKFNYLLIILLPLLLITGPFLSDLSLVILDLTFLYLLIFKKEKLNKDINRILIYVFIGYYLYSTFVSFLSEDLILSLKSSIFYFRFGLFVLAINYFLSFDKNFINKFLKFLILLILFVCFDALIQFIFGFNFLGYKIQSADKLNGVFGNDAILGSYLFRLMPLVIACLIYKNGDKNYRYLTSLFMFFIFSIIFLSGSRASIFLSLIFITLFFVIVRSYQKQIISVGIILFIIFLIFAQFNKKFAYKSYYNIVDPIKRILITKQGNFELSPTEESDTKELINLANTNFTIFTSIHESHFITAFKIYKDNKVFGAGNKMFRILCSRDEYKINRFSCSTHPHNYYLQVLSENGLIGFLIICSFFIICSLNLLREIYFRYFYKLKKINDPCLIIIIGLFINLWPVVPTGNLFNNWLSILIYFPLGFYYFFKKNYKYD